MSTRGINRRKGRKPTTPFLVRFRQKTCGMPRIMCGAPFDAGIPVLAGTDTGVTGVLLGISSQMELVLLVEAGLTTAEALAAATINPARAIGRGNEQGTVERGKLADLLVLDADPLADIHNISKVHLVIKGGIASN